MRPLRATRIAVEAEALRLRLRARRLVVQGVLCVVALAFLVSAVVLAQVAAWDWLRLQVGWTAAGAAAAVAAVDILLGLVVMLMTLRLGPGRDETSARLVRQTAWAAVLDTAALTEIVLCVLRLWRRR